MKATGIVRPVDDLGRITLPKELRRTLNISEKDPLEIYMDGDSIVLKRYKPGCTACGAAKRLVTYRGVKLCENCVLAFARYTKEGAQ